jgi:hypothetical protein
MPAAALGLKENLGGQSATSTSGKDEDAPPPLGHSEVSAVQHSPGEVVKPALGQRRENDGEISAVVRGKESGNVLNEDKPSGANKLVSEPHELEEESGSLACESSASAGDREILAGETGSEETNMRDSVIGFELFRCCVLSVGAVSSTWTSS